MTQVHPVSPLFVRAYRLLFPVVIACGALTLVFPKASPIPSPIAAVGMSVWLLWIGLDDIRIRRVPNTVTYPLMLIGIVRAVACGDGTCLLYWVVFFTLWMMRFMGGGDAKLLMGLFGIYPDFQLAWLVGLCVLITGLPYLAFKYRSRWRTIPRTLLWRLITRQFLPSQAEFEKDAVPYAFSFCLAGAMYLMAPVVWRVCL
jgi:Flp pilus assembly protein protease CpaA